MSSEEDLLHSFYTERSHPNTQFREKGENRSKENGWGAECSNSKSKAWKSGTWGKTPFNFLFHSSMLIIRRRILYFLIWFSYIFFHYDHLWKIKIAQGSATCPNSCSMTDRIWIWGKTQFNAWLLPAMASRKSKSCIDFLHVLSHI